jgi:hypothetical protein
MVLRPWSARVLTAALTTTILAVSAGSAPAAVDDGAPVLRNGGFERGWLAGWGHHSLAGSNGTWQAHEGTEAPISGLPIPAPPEGRSQAVVDQTFAGTHLLFRRIHVGEDMGLELTLWYRNRAGVFFTPRTLRYDELPNQQVRIDVLRTGARLDSMADRAILATPFRTVRGDRFNVGPRRITVDLSAFEGQDVRLRVALVANLFFFQAGVDDVRLVDAGAGAGLGSATRLGAGERQQVPRRSWGVFPR